MKRRAFDQPLEDPFLVGCDPADPGSVVVTRNGEIYGVFRSAEVAGAWAADADASDRPIGAVRILPVLQPFMTLPIPQTDADVDEIPYTILRDDRRDR